MKILVLNLGSTSTKLAIYNDEKEEEKISLSHTKDEYSRFWLEQLDFRFSYVMEFLKGAGYKPTDFDCVISRGGSPPNISSGATAINDALIEALRERPVEPQPANLSPIIARRIADVAGIPAYVYDPITSDDLNPLARVFGVKEVKRDSMCHILNGRAMGISVAREIGRPFDTLTLIVAHIGGGNSIGLWSNGRSIETVPGDACSFSAERCGLIRSEKLLQLTQEYDFKTIQGWMHGKGGFVSLLGTNDLREVEKRIAGGDAEALLCEQAMAYQIARFIASLLPVTEGRADGIVLTGGGAHWDRLVNDIKKRIAFFNIPIYVRPGENEMQSLAEGACRIMKGEEQVHTYQG
ncbi:MAG: butyrate kinase [Candidatus Accumulibacter sp.]|jgi:butyrate kinase|nr:butyrate kinase [Accumulibacter sp.]